MKNTVKENRQKKKLSIENLPIELKEIAMQVPELKQKEVQKVLNDIFNGTEKWQKQVDAIEVKDINDTMSIQLADAARKNVKTARLRAEKIFDSKRDELKLAMSDFKLEDNLWLKSKQIMQLKFKHIEELAKYKSNFVKRYEKEQFDLKVEKRLTQILPYNSEAQKFDVENLTDEMFEFFLNGLIAKKKEKEEAEKLAELKRIADEKLEKERIEKLEAENKRLEKEAKEKERIANIEQKKREKREKIRLEKEKKEREALAKEKARKLAELNAKIEKERLEKERLEKEIQLKKAQELKKIKEEKEKAKKILLAPDKEKLNRLANDLINYQLPVLKSKNSDEIIKNVKILLKKTSNYIILKTKEL